MICQRSLDHKHPTDRELQKLLLCSSSNDALTYLPFLVLNVVNMLFYR